MRQTGARADAGDVIVRLVTLIVALALLAGCSSQEGRRAQELLQQAQAAQAQLRSSSFDGTLGISAEGQKFELRFTGLTSREGEWFSLRTVGAPDGAELHMQMLLRGGRAWVNADGRWRTVPMPTRGGGGTLGAETFQQLAAYVEDVRVHEHELIGGKPVTTIAGEIDTEGMLQTLLDLGSYAEGFSLDFSELGIEIGDIRAVLTIDERTKLLDTASVALSMSARGKQVQLDLRYRLTGANQPVRLPSAPA